MVKMRPEPFRFVMVPVGANNEPVTLIKPMVEVPTFAEPAVKAEPTKPVKKPFVEVTLVIVAFVARRAVILPEFAIKPPIVAFAAKRLVEEAVVAKRLVEVAFVVVLLTIETSPKAPFQRNEGVPSEKVRSVVGVRFEDTVPETVSVEVTVALLVVKPPSKESVAVATEPRLVTERRVSASAG